MFKNNTKKYIKAVLDPYCKTFLKSIANREVCYKCKYTNINRVGDITLGDYWGIEIEHPKFYDEKGVSAIICNTNKGKKIINQIKDKIIYIDSNIEKVSNRNENLIKKII